MSAVEQALAAYRAAVDEVRRAEHVKQRAARALYEARLAAGQQASPTETDSGEPLPSRAFRHAIAYVDEPTADGRRIEPGGVNWQFGQRIPVTLGFENPGTPIGYAIPSHIDDNGGVQATVYVSESVAKMIAPLDTSISLGVGLDSLETDLASEGKVLTIKGGRLRQVIVQEEAKAAWPGVVVKP